MSTTAATLDEPRDLGFGEKVAQQARARLLNRDGSFNVVRRGLPFTRVFDPYHALVTMSWPRFYLVLAGIYIAANLTFAGAYLACGPGALLGAEGTLAHSRFAQAFFFSVQTLATIGYGAVSPRGLAANVVVSIEALVGVIGFSVATGLTFARFSRPAGRFLFSARAVLAPYNDGTGFMFRVINPRPNQLVEVKARVILSRLEGPDRTRTFKPLKLERDSVLFFPLHWTVVHPIDRESPLWGLDPAQLARDDAEFMILVGGTDETTAQTVHARTSYKAEEVVPSGRFANMLLPPEGGVAGIDVRRLDEIEPV